MSLPQHGGGWAQVALGELGFVYGGLSGKSAADFGSGEAKYVTFLDVINNTRVDGRNAQPVRVGPHESQNRVREGDVLFNGTSETPDELALAAVVTDEIPDLYVNSFCFGLRPTDRGRLEPLFLAYLFRSEVGRGLMVALAQGATRYNLSKKQFSRLVLPLPALAEQRRIARAFSGVDDLIASLEGVIEKKQGILTAARQSLLTETRRLASFGQDWRERSLGELCDVVPGGTPDTGVDAFWDGDIPWCTPTDITAGHGRYLDATARTITRKGLEASSARELPENALLLCTRATIGALKLASQTVATNQGFKSLVCGKEVDPVFLYFLLTQRRRDIEALGSGSTFDEVGTSDLKAMIVRLPELAEQRAIAEILADIDDEITLLRQRLAKTRDVKRGMMQELLTGRTRLRAEEVAA